MSYTGCEFHGKYAQVDGTSYAFVIAVALIEAIKHERNAARKAQWEAKLATHRVNANTYPTNMIGGDLGEFASWDNTAEVSFKEALALGRQRIESFGGALPSDFLREALRQEGAAGYIQNGEYDPTPFLETTDTLLKLLEGVESY